MKKYSQIKPDYQNWWSKPQFAIGYAEFEKIQKTGCLRPFIVFEKQGIDLNKRFDKSIPDNPEFNGTINFGKNKEPEELK